MFLHPLALSLISYPSLYHRTLYLFSYPSSTLLPFLQPPYAFIHSHTFPSPSYTLSPLSYLLSPLILYLLSYPHSSSHLCSAIFLLLHPFIFSLSFYPFSTVVSFSTILPFLHQTQRKLMFYPGESPETSFTDNVLLSSLGRN